MCCSCPPCLEAATHLLCAVCGVVVASSSYGCLTFSLYLLTGCGKMSEFTINFQCSIQISDGMKHWQCLIQRGEPWDFPPPNHSLTENIMHDTKLANTLMRLCTAMNTLTIEFACFVVRNFFKLTSVSSGPSIAIIISWGKKTSESQFCSLIR